jgi:hypothetical protein
MLKSFCNIFAYYIVSDIDECRQASSCHSQATCQNTIGSFLCTCNTGYVGNGQQCVGMFNCSNLHWSGGNWNPSVLFSYSISIDILVAITPTRIHIISIWNTLKNIPVFCNVIIKVINRERGLYGKVFAWGFRTDRATKERGLCG